VDSSFHQQFYLLWVANGFRLATHWTQISLLCCFGCRLYFTPATI